MTGAATAALLERTAERLRAESQLQMADDLLRRKDVRARPKPTVLIAGEDKRGKSSLVNALLGRPELSPVGVEVVTGAPISFFYSDPERAAIVRYGEKSPVQAEFEEARRLATVQGNPQNAENIRAVQLGIPCPLLQHVTIVDTPGVGGLDSGHAELTLQSLQFADALFFLVEAGAQFRAAELAFLKRASARIDTVVLVLTKVDLHRGWRTILDDNLAILREQAPRFASCPVVPVSSVLAVRGLQADDPEDAELLREESGFQALEGTLTRYVVDRADVLGDVNVLREAIRPIAVAERAVWEQLSALSTEGAARATLEAEQARLAKLGEDRAEWPRQLDTEVRRLTLQRSEDAARGLTEIRRRYDERLKDPSKQDQESLPGELVADLTALAGRLNEEAAERLTKLVEGLIDDIDDASSLRGSIDRATAARLEEQLGAISMGSHSLNHYDRLSILSSFSSGRSLSTLVTGSGLGLTAGTLIAPPIGIAIGLGLGAFYAYQAFKGKNRTAFTSEFRSWMAEQCTQTQVTVNTTFQREMIDVQDEMRRAVKDALAERERQIKVSLDESKRLLAAEQSERAAAQTDLRARLEACRALQRETRALLEALGSPGGQPAATAAAPA
jgi:hypothetical protein